MDLLPVELWAHIFSFLDQKHYAQTWMVCRQWEALFRESMLHAPTSVCVCVCACICVHVCVYVCMYE